MGCFVLGLLRIERWSILVRNVLIKWFIYNSDYEPLLWKLEYV